MLLLPGRREKFADSSLPEEGVFSGVFPVVVVASGSPRLLGTVLVSILAVDVSIRSDKLLLLLSLLLLLFCDFRKRAEEVDGDGLTPTSISAIVFVSELET